MVLLLLPSIGSSKAMFLHYKKQYPIYDSQPTAAFMFI
jgi:hypothetical protein